MPSVNRAHGYPLTCVHGGARWTRIDFKGPGASEAVDVLPNGLEQTNPKRTEDLLEAD
jgi:hypothetical protein